MSKIYQLQAAISQWGGSPQNHTEPIFESFKGCDYYCYNLRIGATNCMETKCLPFNLNTPKKFHFLKIT